MTLAHDPSSHPQFDQITISGITATGHHGVLSSEREAGQEFSVDLVLGLDLGDAAAGDDLDKTVNYAHLAEATVSVIEGPAVNLIETLAERIAAVTLEHELVESVSVTVHKPHAPIPVPFGSVAVTVHRSRTNPARVSRPFTQEDAPAVASLPSWRDADAPASTIEGEAPAHSEAADVAASVDATGFAAPVSASVAPSVAVSPSPIPTSYSVPSAQELIRENETPQAEPAPAAEHIEVDEVANIPVEETAPPASEPVDLASDSIAPQVEDAESEPVLASSSETASFQEAASATNEPDIAEATDAEIEASNANEVVEVPGQDSITEAVSVPVLEADAPHLAEPHTQDPAHESVASSAQTPHDVPVVQNVPEEATKNPSVDDEPVVADADQAVTPALDEEPAEEAPTHTTQFAALSDTLGVSDASGYPWHQAQSNTVPSGPTLSELLGGNQDEPLDLSKPLFAVGAPKELPPLPKPFFESASVAAAPAPAPRETSTASQVSAQPPAASQAPNTAGQTEWAPPVLAFETQEQHSQDSESLPSRPESAQSSSSAQSADSALSPQTPRSAPSASSSNDLQFAPPISAASPVQAGAAETVPGDGTQAESSSSAENEHTTTLSPSAQQRLEERFAAMMSEHFGIDVTAGNRDGDSPQVAAEKRAAEQGSAASPDEPAPTVSAIPLVASEPTPSQSTTSSPSAESPAPSNDDAPTQVIPVIVPDDLQEDLSRGGTAIIEPAHRPERASALPAEASLNTSMFKTLDQMDEIPQEPVRVVLALGANLGDAQGTLNAAVKALGETESFTIVKVGPLALTAAVGGPEQNDYYNSVVIGETTLSPRELLHATQAIENAHNRTRDVHWGPRTLDIDIITYGMLVASADDLELPHPRAKERAFVLVPWEEADHEAVLPGLGGGPVSALAATAPDRSGVRWLALNWLT